MRKLNKRKILWIVKESIRQENNSSYKNHLSIYRAYMKLNAGYIHEIIMLQRILILYYESSEFFIKENR